MTILDHAVSASPTGPLSFVWLKLTGKCQLGVFWTNAVTAASQRMKSGVGRSGSWTQMLSRSSPVQSGRCSIAALWAALTYSAKR